MEKKGKAPFSHELQWNGVEMRTVATQRNSTDGSGKAEAWHGDDKRGYAKEVNSTDGNGKAEAEQRKAREKHYIQTKKKQDFERRQPL